MPKWLTFPRQPQPSAFAVDRFTVLDGCVIATGWAENEQPVLLHKGRPVPGASSTSFARDDLLRAFGSSSTARGFRISAAFVEPPDQLELALRFKTAEVTPASAASFDSGPKRRTVNFEEMKQQLIDEITPARCRLLEIGSRARSGFTYRHLFPSWVSYTGLDMTDGPNVDVVGDAHHLTKHLTGTFDFVFSVSVFEHLLMPWAVALEINRALAVRGLAYIQSHAAWPLHDEPWDFFRFSQESWFGLFNCHTGFEIVDVGYSIPASIVPRYGGDSTISGLDTQPTFLLSACLARKIGPSQVRWDADPGEVLNLAYNHGARR